MSLTKTQQNIYIDLDQLKEKEDPRYFRIKELLQTYLDAKDEEDRAKAAKKEVAVELEDLIIKWGADGLVLGDSIATQVAGKSAGKWNKDRLTMILTPEQLEQVWTEGKSFSYVKVEHNPNRAAQARED